jgi:hypothetical protein
MNEARYNVVRVTNTTGQNAASTTPKPTPTFWSRVKTRASGAAAGLTKISKSKGVQRGAKGVGNIFHNAGKMFDEPKGKQRGGDVFTHMDGMFDGGHSKRRKKKRKQGRKVVIYV